MNLLKRPNAKGDKITFYYDYGRGAGQRPSTGIFIYTKPNLKHSFFSVKEKAWHGLGQIAGPDAVLLN